MKKLLLLPFLSILSFSAFSQSIYLDNSFNSSGFRHAIFTQTLTHISDMVVQPDSKIVAAIKGEELFRLCRLNTDGTYDNTFGSQGNGKVELDFGMSGAGKERCEAIALQSDGKILVAGYASAPLVAHNIRLTRLTSNGIPDSTFGINGVAEPIGYFTSGMVIDDMLVEPGGRIVLTGHAGNAGLICRFNDNGSFVSQPGSFLSWWDFEPKVKSFALLPNGNMILSADCATSRVHLYNITPGLSLNFMSDYYGRTVSHSLYEEYTVEVLAQSTGKVILCTRNKAFPEMVFIGRYDQDGNVDSSFGTNGEASYAFGPMGDTALPTTAILTPTNDIIIGGTVHSDAGNTDYRVMYISGIDGSLQTSWCDDGKITTDLMVSDDSVYSLVLQPDGKLLAGGSTNEPEIVGQGPMPSIVRYGQSIPMAISEVAKKAELQVFPNPSNGAVCIKGDETLTLQIVNAVGQMIRTVELSSANYFTVNVTGLPTGVFFVRSTDGRVRNKIISL